MTRPRSSSRRRGRLLPVLLVVLAVWPASAVRGQAPSVPPSAAAAADAAVQDRLAEVLAVPRYVPLGEAVRLFDAAAHDTTRASSPEADVLRARRDALRRDVGLTLRGGAERTVGAAVLDDDGFAYRHRATVALEWDLLRGGLAERRLEARALEAALAAEAGRGRLGYWDDHYSPRYAQLLRSFNEERLSVLRARRAVQDDLVAALGALYDARQIGWERVAEATSARAEVDVLAAGLEAYNAHTPAGAAAPDGALPAFTLPLEPLLEAVEAWYARRAAAEAAGRVDPWADHPARRVALKPYVRYNAYERPEEAGLRDRLSVGVAFSMPLGGGGQRDVERALEAQRRARAEDAAREARKEVRVHFHEHQAHLRQYHAFYGTARRLRARIDRALEARRLGADVYSPVATLALMDEYLAVRAELVDLRLKLYVKALAMASHAAPGTVAALARPVDAAAGLHPMRPQTAVYVWSDDFAARTNAALVAGLRAEDVATVYVSLGGEAALEDKARAFVSEAHAAGLTVRLLLGSNLVVYPRNHERLDRHVARAAALGFDGVQLDVEPHTLDDWDAAPDSLTAHYDALLRRAGRLAAAAGLHVGVAVPARHPALVAAAARRVDDVDVMLYGVTDPAALADRLLALDGLASARTRVTLRPADFASPAALADAMAHVARHTPYHRFALHDAADVLAATSPDQP